MARSRRSLRCVRRRCTLILRETVHGVPLVPYCGADFCCRTGDHRKRDWYTYNELLPARTLIAQRGQAIAQKEKGDRSPVERQLLKLAQDLDNLESMLTMLDPLRVDFDIVLCGDLLYHVSPAADDESKLEGQG